MLAFALPLGRLVLLALGVVSHLQERREHRREGGGDEVEARQEVR